MFPRKQQIISLKNSRPVSWRCKPKPETGYRLFVDTKKKKCSMFLSSPCPAQDYHHNTPRPRHSDHRSDECKTKCVLKAGLCNRRIANIACLQRIRGNLYYLTRKYYCDLVLDLDAYKQRPVVNFREQMCRFFLSIWSTESKGKKTKIEELVGEVCSKRTHELNYAIGKRSTWHNVCIKNQKKKDGKQHRAK